MQEKYKYYAPDGMYGFELNDEEVAPQRAIWRQYRIRIGRHSWNLGRADVERRERERISNRADR